MNTIQKRFLMFLGACIPTRVLIGYLGKKYYNHKNIKFLGYITMIISIGFIYIFTIGSKRADSQLEWSGEKKIWWNDFRIIHGILYLLFSYHILKKSKDAWKFIAIDTTIGLLAFFHHHNVNNNYSKLF